MRGHYQISSKIDPRWNKIGRDFICPNRGALNFDISAWIDRMCLKLECIPPGDLTYLVYFGEQNGSAGTANRIW